MLDVDLIKRLFRALNEELSRKGVVGEIGLCGGAVMCLVFNARKATRDIDAVFSPVKELRQASRTVAKQFGLPEDWLNDAAKGFFFSDPPRIPVMELAHLRVWAPPAAYMMAMKALAGRFDTHDKDDVRFLLNHLKIADAQRAFDIIATYCPHSRIPAKTRFLIEELLT